MGPGGQTLGELKQDVRDARALFMSALLCGEVTDDLLGILLTAQNMLQAAYIRMGLEYVAP